MPRVYFVAAVYCPVQFTEGKNGKHHREMWLNKGVVFDLPQPCAVPECGTKVLESNLRGQSTSSSRTHICTLPERVYVVDQAETYLIVIVCSQYKGVSAREKVREVVHSPLNSSY